MASIRVIGLPKPSAGGSFLYKFVEPLAEGEAYLVPESATKPALQSEVNKASTPGVYYSTRDDPFRAGSVEAVYNAAMQDITTQYTLLKLSNEGWSAYETYKLKVQGVDGAEPIKFVKINWAKGWKRIVGAELSSWGWRAFAIGKKGKVDPMLLYEYWNADYNEKVPYKYHDGMRCIGTAQDKFDEDTYAPLIRFEPDADGNALAFIDDSFESDWLRAFSLLAVT